MKHKYIFLVIAIFFTSSVYGQKVLKTNSGQRILLVDDGSWRLLSPIENVENISAEKGTSLNSFKSPKQGKHPVNADQRQDIQNLLTNFLSDEAQLLVNIEMGKQKLNQLINQKSSLKEDEIQLIKLNDQINNTKLDIEIGTKNYNSISELIQTSNELLEGKLKNKEKALVTLQSGLETFQDINLGMGGTLNETQVKKTNKETTISKKTDINYPTVFLVQKDIDIKDNYDCEIVFNGFDKDIGSERKEVKTQRFFGFTQQKMKPYLKTDDFLTCDANISKVGSKYFLTLIIRIRSKDAGKTYGTLQQNEKIKIELINGRRVYGRNIISDSGQIETYTGHTLYKGVFEIEKEDIKELKNHYLDHIGLIWSSGYEQYDIYNVDFLKNQLECLTK